MDEAEGSRVVDGQNGGAFHHLANPLRREARDWTVARRPPLTVSKPAPSTDDHWTRPDEATAIGRADWTLTEAMLNDEPAFE